MTLDFENLDDFFSTTEFALTAQFGPEESEVDVVGIFTAAGEILNTGDGHHVTTAMASFITPAADISSYAQGDRVAINGAEYTIYDIVPDGTGLSTVQLHEA